MPLVHIYAMHCMPKCIVILCITVFKQLIVKCLISISFRLFNGQFVSILLLESIFINRTTTWANDTAPKRGSCNNFVLEIIQFVIPAMLFDLKVFFTVIKLLDTVIRHYNILF